MLQILRMTAVNGKLKFTKNYKLKNKDDFEKWYDVKKDHHWNPNFHRKYCSGGSVFSQITVADTL